MARMACCVGTIGDEHGEDWRVLGAATKKDGHWVLTIQTGYNLPPLPRSAHTWVGLMIRSLFGRRGEEELPFYEDVPVTFCPICGHRLDDPAPINGYQPRD